MRRPDSQQVGDRPINCIKRVSKNQAAGEEQAMRLRNALLDLSDCEGESSHGRSSESLESSNGVTADDGQRRTARKNVDGDGAQHQRNQRKIRESRREASSH